MDFRSIIDMIYDWTLKLSILAWAMVGLSWVIGWMLRGAPIPILKIKRFGHSLIEDAVLAALWLALGSTVFFLISSITKNLTPPTVINVTAPVSVQ
ncbi:hypothetical protein EYM_03110 [Ignicoccus islandicus DSM 13165]|uniref:Uncharacterized protein n=1 Tax=Ignicoccus islandicus DSM 13165 TaxID=940295 RepID=A0A0U3EB00_9CREN|nr:DNA import protein CedA1 [Ignicoccus islandicus]ALU11619.1 hypothetical protein EYM_03110 [Ignicoccus islandicus DSM 13165]